MADESSFTDEQAVSLSLRARRSCELGKETVWCRVIAESPREHEQRDAVHSFT
ncbi:unnamed protein product [Penicillium camemberti]|uniref:Str. FM013 n=1 Tax=Penicillium camemberti (strain FM 013) TaxID=1429867 RepID=A0A0G4PWG6_PENC3|nr:unnamed protein product [Penicillium camemberti]